MAKWVFLSVLSLFSGVFVYLYFYLGAFKPVIIATQTKGPYHILYKEHIGPYHKINPVIQAVEAWTSDNNIPCPQTFGYYFDDPSTAESSDRLRSWGGCLLVAPVEHHPPSFHSGVIDEAIFITAEFEGSPAISPFKVYPKVFEFAKDHRFVLQTGTIEIYTLTPQRSIHTLYLFRSL